MFPAFSGEVEDTGRRPVRSSQRVAVPEEDNGRRDAKGVVSGVSQIAQSTGDRARVV